MGVQKDPKFSDHLTLEKYVIQATKKLTVGRRNNQNGSLAVLQGTWVYVHFFPSPLTYIFTRTVSHPQEPSLHTLVPRWAIH